MTKYTEYEREQLKGFLGGDAEPGSMAFESAKALLEVRDREAASISSEHTAKRSAQIAVISAAISLSSVAATIVIAATS